MSKDVERGGLVVVVVVVVVVLVADMVLFSLLFCFGFSMNISGRLLSFELSDDDDDDDVKTDRIIDDF